MLGGDLLFIFEWLNNQLLKMEWLSSLVTLLVKNVFGLDINSSGFARGLIANGPNIAYRTSNIAINDGAWHYIVYVYNASGLSLDIYVDGKLNN